MPNILAPTLDKDLSKRARKGKKEVRDLPRPSPKGLSGDE
jgi:hypothetical protein